nr:DUF3043 domain-containing protein [Streptomyces decoyicus]
MLCAGRTGVPARPGAGSAGAVAGSCPVGPWFSRGEHVPLGLVFRSRSKDEQAATAKVTADQPQQPRDPQAPKGRPTPKRSDSQSQRRSRAHTPANRKDATKAQREARRADMARQREAMASGDERYLPVRDKGPVRRFARDYVDSRWAVAEFFLPMAVVILVLTMIRVPSIQSIALLLWLVIIVLIVIDSALIWVRLGKLLQERFPNENLKGVKPYAVMRTLQMRRLRLPKPQVKRGEKP